MTKQTSRKFKIHGLYRPSGSKEGPQLELSGIWIGQTANLTTMDGLLVIEPIETQEHKAALSEVWGMLEKLVK